MMHKDSLQLNEKIHYFMLSNSLFHTDFVPNKLEKTAQQHQPSNGAACLSAARPQCLKYNTQHTCTVVFGPFPRSQPGNPSASILDDIGSMFDDLADQLDAMLD